MTASTILPLTLRLSLRSRSTYHNQHQLQLQLKRTTRLSPPLTKPLACLSTLSTTTSLATNTKRLLLPQQQKQQPQQQPHSPILNSSSIRNKSTNNLDYHNNTKIMIGNDNNNDIIDNNTRKFSSRNSSANANATNTKSNSNANANPNEVDKFTSFASHWWDSRSNPLVGMNPIRVKFMMETVAKEVVTTSNPSATNNNNNNNNNNIAANHHHHHHHLPLRNKRVLDIGCGGGLLTESFSRLGASLVAGVDASPKVVEVAKMHSFHDNNNLTSSSAEWNESNNTNDTGNNKNSNTPEERKIMYIGGKTVEEFASHWLSKHEQEQHNETTATTTSSLNNNTSQFELFDVITTLEVIEHVPNPSSLLHAAISLLKPGGILFVSTINRTAKSYGVAIVGAEYVTGMVPVGTHDWNQFWSPEEVRGMVCGSGAGAGAGDSGGTMKQIAVNGMVVNPLNMEWSLDASDVDVNWIGAYQKKE